MVMDGSLLCCYCALQSLHHLRRIPFDGPEVPADLASLAVHQQGRRQARRVEHERRLGGRVDVERQGLDADLAIELVRDGGAWLVDRKRNHLEALAAELGL